MAKTLFLKGTCSQQRHYLSAIILSSPPKTSSVSKTMAVCSSFSPLLPCRFRRRSRPISYLSRKPQFFVSYKAFSAQANTSTTKDEMPACIGFLGRGIMDSPIAQNLIKAGYKASPEEVAASCDVTFAMLADPQSALC